MKNQLQMQVQINSLEALQRLLGPDEDGAFSVELSKSLADWLLDKHLPKIADSSGVEFNARLQGKLEAIREKTAKEVGITISRTGEARLSAELNKMIQEQVLSSVKGLVRDEINLKLVDLPKLVESTVTGMLNSHVTRQIDQTVNRQLAQVLKHMTDLSAYYKAEVATASEVDRKIVTTL